MELAGRLPAGSTERSGLVVDYAQKPCRNRSENQSGLPVPRVDFNWRFVKRLRKHNVTVRVATRDRFISSGPMTRFSSTWKSTESAACWCNRWDSRGIAEC